MRRRGLTTIRGRLAAIGAAACVAAIASAPAATAGGAGGRSPSTVSGGYTLDGWGAVHGWGTAAGDYRGAYWPGWDIARGIAALNGDRGYVLDGWGGVHGFARTGHPLPPPLSQRFGTHLPSWRGWDIARDIAIRSGPDGEPLGGYVLDGWGGVHAFGDVPAVRRSDYTAGVDRARGLAVTFTEAGAVEPGMYWIDGRGAIHPVVLVGQATVSLPELPTTHADVWRDLAVRSTDGASMPVVLQMSRRGVLRAVGPENPPRGAPFWPLWDIARAFALVG